MAPANRPPLTPRQREVLAVVGELIALELRPATVRKVGRRFEIASTNGVQCHFRALVKKGYLIQAGSGMARGFVPAGLAEAVGPAVRAFMAELLTEGTV